MKLLKSIYPGLILLMAISFFSCKNKKPEEKDIVKEPEQLADRVRHNLQDVIDYAGKNDGKINDSLVLKGMPALKRVYEKNGYAALWSADGSWLPVADSVFEFIGHSMHYGLFPADYNYPSLSEIQHRLSTDSLARKDAALWSRGDLLLSDAVLAISKDLKRGRLPYDSLTSRKDTVLDENFYENILSQVINTKGIHSVLEKLETNQPGYQALKSGIGNFLDSADFRKYTYLSYPYKDSAVFYTLLQKRLFEANVIDSPSVGNDTAALRKAIAGYQLSRKLKSTGRINENTVNSLNDTDWERFKRIAINLDKYKLMPDTMPWTYVWVNIPSFQLKVINCDTLALESRVIVGAPKTRTPELYSEISNFITYPQWTVPYSIVFKEMLPQIQKNINYLMKQNLMVVDRYDSVIDPAKIDWSKLNKNKFPYQIKQREGDDNSLGVMKFNFRNPYAVYLHDTNARWMFSRTARALSHGCVRVQNYEGLAHFLVRDNIDRFPPDTLISWIVRQEKHTVSGFKKVPIFIRYFSCEGKNGRVKFYDDIYAEDKMLAERYFNKYIN